MDNIKILGKKMKVFNYNNLKEDFKRVEEKGGVPESMQANFIDVEDVKDAVKELEDLCEARFDEILKELRGIMIGDALTKTLPSEENRGYCWECKTEIRYDSLTKPCPNCGGDHWQQEMLSKRY